MKIKHLLYIVLLVAVTFSGCKKDPKGSLATVSTNAATGVTGSAVVTGGNITNTGNSNISASGIVWATHSNPTLSDSISSNSTGGKSFSIKLNSLHGNTEYHVRAYATNGTGTAYGNDVTFTTQPGLATVTTTLVGSIKQSNASAPTGGTVVSDGGASITATGVCWSKNPHPTISDSFTTDVFNANGKFSSTMTNLGSGVTYYYRAYATNSFGTAYGNELSFNAGATSTVTDADGNVYVTITIGTQTWMTSNLKTTHFQNGDAIRDGSNDTDWYPGGSTIPGPGPAYTYSNGNPATNDTLGKLYSLAVIRDSRGLAPAGWHVATVRDFEVLEFNEGMAAQDTVIKTVFRQFIGNIGTKLVKGGSSGLSLQLAGEGSPNNYFPGSGVYWTATTTTSIFGADSGNITFCIYLNGIDPTYFGSSGFPEGAAVRFVKN